MGYLGHADTSRLVLDRAIDAPIVLEDDACDRTVDVAESPAEDQRLDFLVLNDVPGIARTVPFGTLVERAMDELALRPCLALAELTHLLLGVGVGRPAHGLSLQIFIQEDFLSRPRRDVRFLAFPPLDALMLVELCQCGWSNCQPLLECQSRKVECESFVLVGREGWV